MHGNSYAGKTFYWRIGSVGINGRTARTTPVGNADGRFEYRFTRTRQDVTRAGRVKVFHMRPALAAATPRPLGDQAWGAIAFGSTLAQINSRTCFKNGHVASGVEIRPVAR